MQASCPSSIPCQGPCLGLSFVMSKANDVPLSEEEGADNKKKKEGSDIKHVVVYISPIRFWRGDAGEKTNRASS